jgi:hypothetical protein
MQTRINFETIGIGTHFVSFSWNFVLEKIHWLLVEILLLENDISTRC